MAVSSKCTVDPVMRAISCITVDEPAARWIAHEAQARQVPQRLGQRKNAGRIGGEVASQTEILACEQHRRAMVADRAAHQDRIAGANLIEAEPQARAPDSSALKAPMPYEVDRDV